MNPFSLVFLKEVATLLEISSSISFQIGFEVFGEK